VRSLSAAMWRSSCPNAAVGGVPAVTAVLTNPAQCSLRSESDRNGALPRNDAMGQKLTLFVLVPHILCESLEFS
jgi:hypothetical protein